MKSKFAVPEGTDLSTIINGSFSHRGSYGGIQVGTT